MSLKVFRDQVFFNNAFNFKINEIVSSLIKQFERKLSLYWFSEVLKLSY